MPLITLGWLPFFILGAIYYTFHSLKKKQIPELTIYIIFESLFLSINPHKEDRFLMKLLPFMFILIGIGVRIGFRKFKGNKWLYIVLKFGIAFNLLYFGYSSLVDKRGAMDLMEDLRVKSDSIKDIIFFTECHRTPYYSILHK